MEKLKAVWRHFVVTLPIWLALASAILLVIGYRLNSGIASEADLQKLLYTIASATLGGGVFAAVLKAMQFMNVFRDAMEEVVAMDRRWLASLSDTKLRAIWRDVMAVTVQKGFPELSRRLEDEVFDQVIPKLGSYYYSKMNRRIELTNYDPAAGLLEINEQYELIINAHSEQTAVPYKFHLSGEWPQAVEEPPHRVTWLSIDGADFRGRVQYEGVRGGPCAVHHDIELSGKKAYSVHRHMTRRTNVASDPILHMVATRFTESMLVSIDNRVASHINVAPMGIGVVGKGLEVVLQEPQITRCEINQLLFPGDGLLLVFQKKA